MNSLSFKPDIPAPITPKMRWWYEALADFWLANPTATNIEAGKFFGREPSTISAVKNSDAFKAFFEKRKAEQRSELDAAIKSRMMGVTFTALDSLHDKLKSKRDTLSVGELTQALDTIGTLTNGKSGIPGGVTVNVNSPGVQQTLIAPVSMSDLQEAREALRRHQSSISSGPVVIDSEVASEATILPPSKEPASS